MILRGDAGRLVPTFTQREGRSKKKSLRIRSYIKKKKKQQFKDLRVGRLVIPERADDLIASRYNINLRFTYYIAFIIEQRTTFLKMSYYITQITL